MTPVACSAVPMLLRDLPPLLREEPGFASVLGRSSAVLAVPEPARALTIAGLATLSSRRPLVVAVPTTGDAERLANDLRTFLGPDAVDIFPAWETLPFERVSPSVETMGRRLRTMWRLRDAERAPRVLVAPVRALVQRLGPHVEDVEPVVVVPGEQRRPRRAGRARWSATGYRREEQVEHRGEVAVRGSIVDVFPSTADVPVRIDLWGDEVDRLTEFSVADQRSTDDLAAGRDLRVPRAAAHRRGARAGRARSSASSRGAASSGSAWPRGRPSTAWRPGCRGSPRASTCCSTSSGRRPRAAARAPPHARPRRRHPRRGGRPGRHARQDLGRDAAGDDEGFPRLHLPFDRLLAHTDAPAWTVTTAPEGPDVATVASMGWPPVVGDGPSGWCASSPSWLGDGYRVVVAADGDGLGAARARRQGVHLARRATADRARRHRSSARSSGASSCPAVKLAVLAEPDLTGRRRAHRAGPPAAAATPRASSTTSSPATTSCTTSTGWPATAAW